MTSLSMIVNEFEDQLIAGNIILWEGARTYRMFLMFNSGNFCYF